MFFYWQSLLLCVACRSAAGLFGLLGGNVSCGGSADPRSRNDAETATSPAIDPADQFVPAPNCAPSLDRPPTHGAIAKIVKSDAKNEATLRSKLHRRAFRKQVKAQITPTLDSDLEIDTEIQELLAALEGN